MVSLPPESSNIAFKEWSGVCDALIDGRQTVIFRKGGISEAAGPGQFAPEHAAFWLYPTWSHQSQTGLRSLGEETANIHPTAPHPEAPISIRGFVCLGLVGCIKCEDALPPFRPLHCLEDETILKRFHYRRPGLWVLAARVWRREPAFSVFPTPQYAGCATWVILKQPLPTSGLTPVLDDTQWAQQCDRIRFLLGSRAPVED